LRVIRATCDVKLRGEDDVDAKLFADSLRQAREIELESAS